MWMIEQIEVDPEQRGRYVMDLCEGGLQTRRISVDESTLGQFLMRKGMEMDSVLLEEILYFDTGTTAYRCALLFLSQKMRTTKEVVCFLEEEGFTQPVIQKACQKLQNYGLLNDVEYARAFVRTKKNVERIGRRAIEQQGLQKGIQAADLEEGLLQYTKTEERQAIEYWLRKIQKRIEKYSTREKEQRIRSFLQQKGFGMQLISVVLAEQKEKVDMTVEDIDWEPLVKQGEKLLRKYANVPDDFTRNRKIKQTLYRKGFQADAIARFLKQYASNIDT